MALVAPYCCTLLSYKSYIVNSFYIMSSNSFGEDPEQASEAGFLCSASPLRSVSGGEGGVGGRDIDGGEGAG